MMNYNDKYPTKEYRQYNTNQQAQRIENQEYFEIIALEPKYKLMSGKKTNQQATADHTAKMFNHSRTQHLAWGGNPATLGIVLPKDYILIDDYPIHAGYRHNKDGYVWMYDGSGWVLIEYYNEEIKMTRNEAIEKFNKAYDSKYGQGSAIKMIAALEALGLIKFEKSVVNEAKEYVRNYTLYDRKELAGVIDMLIRHIEK